jgi:hypothetical protein
MQKVYPPIPRFVLENYAQELTWCRTRAGASLPDPRGRGRRAQLCRCPGRLSAAHDGGAGERQAPERDQAGQARYDAIRAGRTREENARVDARIRDQSERRTVIQKLVSANRSTGSPT